MTLAFPIREFNGQGLVSEVARTLTSLLRRYGLFISVDGDFVDLATKNKLRRNQVKCLLRRDYLNFSSSKVQGSELNKIIDKYLNGLVEATRHVAGTPELKQFMQEVEIPDSYL